MSGMNPLDFNTADQQSSAFDLLPIGTLVKIRLTIRPGGLGPEGWITQSKTSEAQYLNCEAVVLQGPYAKRRVYTRIGLRGKGGHGSDDSYANRGRALIRAMLESARGVPASDGSDRARAARTIRGFGELNGIEFVARIGIEKDKNNPNDEGRNVIAAAVGPEHADYLRVMGTPPQPALTVVAAAPAMMAPPAAPAGQAGPAPSWAAPEPAPGTDTAPFWAR